MNRTIKFRAWDTYCNRMRWEEDYGIVPDTGKPHWIHDQEFIQGKATQLILMQFTGFLDSEGKEVYEGDILEIYIQGDKQVSAYIVNSIEEFYFDLNREDSYYRITAYKLLGNIFENES